MTRTQRIEMLTALVSVTGRAVADAAGVERVPLTPEMRHRLADFAEAAQVLGRLAQREIIHLEAARDWPANGEQ